MQKQKIEGDLSQGRVKDTLNTWKVKAISRREENAKLRKRIKELSWSRDNWKAKCMDLKNGAKKVKDLSTEKAFRHQYSLLLVNLILALHQYGTMSLRSCRHSLFCMLVCLGLESRTPSHTTIRNWLCKSGYYRIGENQNQGGDYVLYVDESIVFGSEKILLILGVSLNKIHKSKALSHADMNVLYVGSSQEWKGLAIEKELLKIAKNKEIKYIVSDQGSNLRKAYKSLNYIHIEDCTHILANYLKHIYEKDSDFEAFRKLVGKLRRTWNLSKNKSQYMPPSLRGKMRFANIFPCVNWAKKCLQHWDNLSKEVQESLLFLKENNEFIHSLIEVEIVFKTVCEKLKNNGFGAIQKQEILSSLAELKAGKRAIVFIQNCSDYLDNLSKKSELLQEDYLLCSSDIIESYFGKFKTKINPNARSGLTEFIFTIANFSQQFSVEETKKALESVTCKDLFGNKKHQKSA